MLPVKRSLGKCSFAGEQWGQALTLHRCNRLTINIIRVFSNSQINARCHNVDQVRRGRYPAISASPRLNRSRPMSDERCCRSTFVIEVFVLSKRCVIQMRPALPDEYIGMRVAGILALIFSLYAGFSIPTIVRHKQDQCVIKYAAVVQCSDELTDVLINLFHHCCIDGHHVVVPRFFLVRERFPFRNVIWSRFQLPSFFN